MKEKFAIVIEPDKDLNLEIRNLKKQFENVSKGDYIKHPNHLTLLHGLFNEKELIETLETFNFNKFLLNTEKINVFENDMLTTFDTLFLSVIKSQPLLDLQMRLIILLKDIIDNKYLDSFFKNSTNYMKNLLDYGYPFVGEDWIPHFTVCSLDFFSSIEARNNLNKSIEKSMIVKNLTIFRVIKSEHTKIFEVST